MRKREPTLLTIEPPHESDTDVIVRPFDAFRIFYGRSGDVPAARAFLVAKSADRCFGFVHLIPYLDTLAMRDAWILEDLFVEPAARRSGVGGALMRRAEAFARSTGAGRISLTTAHTNRTAQSLYVAHGYVLDDVFRTYPSRSRLMEFVASSPPQDDLAPSGNRDTTAIRGAGIASSSPASS